MGLPKTREPNPAADDRKAQVL